MDKLNAQGAGEESVPHHGQKRQAVSRLRAYLRDEVRNRAGRTTRDWLKRFSDLPLFPVQARSHR
ncbi:MAG TPA: hypothetical protein DCM39_18600 [Pantoea sp.]|nr:hypothetical protein [Pantoea sp.]